jgi:hypothetical protein
VALYCTPDASSMCLQVHLQVDQPGVMDASLLALRRIPQLQVLSIAVGSFILDERQMSQLGELPVADLTLISQVYKKQPTLPRPCCSHLDNAGVKAYVDAVCQRCDSALKLACGIGITPASAQNGVDVTSELHPAACTR